MSSYLALKLGYINKTYTHTQSKTENSIFQFCLTITCLSAIPLDHDDLLRFPGQKIAAFLLAQVQIYITKELKCVFM